MNTKYRNRAAGLLAAASLMFSPAAWSLGLGDITVESFLNQPLQVRIDLITRETDNLETVTAQLASARDYELIGADRESIPVPVHFTVEDIEGDAYILGTSGLPLSNPVVRLILEVNWSSGRMLREYTVFLDPPTHTAAAPIPRVDERRNPPAAVEAVAEPADTQASVSAAEPPPADVQSRPAEASQPRVGEYGPVSSGETLWAIARDWSRGSGLEINKVMIAIQRENPEAFSRGNINLLKRGAILRMPQIGDIESITMAAAIQEVTSQTDEFRGRRSAEPVASPSTPLLADETSVPESPPAPQEVEAAAPAAETAGQTTEEEPVMEARDQLELVPPSEEADLDSTYGFEEAEEGDADASVSVSSLRENLARTEEELITQQQENEYLADRISELETQLAQATEDAARDADLANMEERLRQERQAREAEAGKQDTKPWYKGFTAWLIGLLVLVVAAVGWFLSRRGGGDEIISDLGSGDEQLREIKGEAEDVLRVLEEPAGEEIEAADEAEEFGGDEAPEEPPAEEQEVKPFGATGDDAEVLDEESSDPEIQLDLARAYISMGDKEAARVILEEVGTNGSAEQQEEAKKMLELLVS
jgi:pilus assembly protein FimV